MTRSHRVLVAHPSSELYGSDRVALETVRGLVATGWQVTVSVASDGPLVPVLRATGADVVVFPVPVVRRTVLSPGGFVRLVHDVIRRAPAMMRFVRSLRPDVVYVSTITVPWWLVVARLCGSRVVCHVHEAEEGIGRPARTALVAPLLLAHRILANSARSRDVIARDIPRLAPVIEVVYNGVGGPPTSHPLRDRLDGPARLLLVGRISPRKGTDVAVEALAELVARGVDVELELVGGVFPGYEWFEENVRRQVEDSGLAARVRWSGVLSDVWDVLAAADIALVPSRVEPFGNAAVEALLAGRPVVVGDTQGLREIVRAGENGELVTPGDPRALADAVERIVRGWPAARARAAAAQVEARARFAPERYRDDVADAVERTLHPIRTDARNTQ